MTLIAPTEGERTILGYILSNNVKLHLYTSPVINPSYSNVLADLTEVSDSDYASITLTGGSWTISTNMSNITSGTYAEQTFNLSGTYSNTIYGYYITDSAITHILWMEKFAAAETFTTGGSLSITPYLALQ